MGCGGERRTMDVSVRSGVYSDESARIENRVNLNLSLLSVRWYLYERERDREKLERKKERERDDIRGYSTRDIDLEQRRENERGEKTNEEM
jgi:hypothetical protein